MGPRPELTLEQYLSTDEWPGERLEWVNGEPLAMSGGSPRHAAVTVNLLVELGIRLRGSDCRPINGDQRVNIALSGAYLYPDAGIVCGAFVFAENDPHSITNPAVLFEVPSPSTRDHDQGAKFDHYRRLASLQHYVLVDPAARHVIHHARQGSGWFRLDLEDGAVQLDHLELPLDALYRDLSPVGG